MADVDFHYRDVNDLECQQRMAGSKQDVEWRLEHTASLSLIAFVIAVGLAAFMWWVLAGMG